MFKRLSLIASIGLAGCATAPNSAEIDYGNPPINPRAAVIEYFEPRLKDPASAHYKVGEPVRATARNGLLFGGGIGFAGYIVDVELNAKNSFGGYTGWEPWTVFFVGDKATDARPGRLGSWEMVYRE